MQFSSLITPSTTSLLTATPVLWMLIVAQLDPYKIEYSTKDIVPMLGGIQAQSLRRYCRDLWPGLCGRNDHYYLSFDDACVLIYRACRDGRKLPERRELHSQLIEDGVITRHFPNDFPRIERASRAIINDRNERAAQRNIQRAISHHSPNTPSSLSSPKLTLA